MKPKSKRTPRARKAHPKPDPIFVAIDKHVAAYDRMKEVGKEHTRAEERHQKEPNWAGFKAVDRKWNAAVGREQSALTDVAAVRTTNPEAFSAKAQFR